MIGTPLGRVKLGARVGHAFYDPNHPEHLRVLIGSETYFAHRRQVTFIKKEAQQ